MRRIFRSLQYPDKYAYAYDSEVWDSHSPQVHRAFRQYETYGDGLTAHSHDWPITREFMTDYLASLATVMLDPPALTGETETERLIQHVAMEFTRNPGAEAFEFCRSVVFKPSTEGGWHEKKTRYYSVELRQLSASESKQHDKRFEKVEQWNDGSPKAIQRMLYKDYYGGLACYTLTETLREWIFSLPDYRSSNLYMPLTATFLEWFKGEKDEQRKAQDLRQAFGACRAICQAYNLRCEAETHLGNIHRPEVKPAEEVA